MNLGQLKIVCKSRESGSLYIKNIENFNMSLLSF